MLTRSRPRARRSRRPLRALFILLLALAIAAFVLFRGGDWMMRQRYRYPHRDLVERYAAEQSISPALVAAVIYSESRFRQDAVSRLGARGLMQLMPDTAEWIAQKLDETDGYTFDRMFNPETNIRYGCWYLGFLSRCFGGDIIKIAAGYHAGQNAVFGWLDDPSISPNGWTIAVDDIPYADTRQYVEKVVKTYAIYQKYYYAPVAAS